MRRKKLEQAEEVETPPTPRVKELTGVIARIVKPSGFGFITGDDGADYFFHASAVRNRQFDEESFCAGTRVRFIGNDSPKGPRALNIEALDEAANG